VELCYTIKVFNFNINKYNEKSLHYKRVLNITEFTIKEMKFMTQLVLGIDEFIKIYIFSSNHLSVMIE
jgi:hypothetical protein